MDYELKDRFRRFAGKTADDHAVDDDGLTGRNLKTISDAIEDLVVVRHATLQELADEALAECGQV